MTSSQVQEEARSRRLEARATARDLVESLESGQPIDQCLLKAQRLARLLRDGEAQAWVRFEASGYPSTGAEEAIGWCVKYAYRYIDGELKYLKGLPQLESEMIASKLILEKIQGPSISAPAENFLVARATQEVLGTINATIAACQKAHVAATASFQQQKTSLHAYATDTLISLELGDVVEDLFESARGKVDLFVRAKCPQAAEQLIAVNERMREGTTEARAAALTSCRRLLQSIADVAFPPSDVPYKDGAGKNRDVGKGAYKNRLAAYVEQSLASGSTARIMTAELEHLVARLDAIYEKACKGVHDTVSSNEAELVIMQTYVFLGELAHLSQKSRSGEESSAAESTEE